MSDLIERQAAIDALRVAYWDDNIQSAKDDPCIVDAMTDWAIRQVKALPPAQPERETAKFIRWMECKKTADYISYTPHCKCSKCGTEFLIETIKYCYMCGARMER